MNYPANQRRAPVVNDHEEARVKALAKMSNLGRCYLDLRQQLAELRAGGIDALRARVEADARTIAALVAEVHALRRPSAPSELPQIDPQMLPEGCALPAFDGVEEAQMAVLGAGDAYLQTR